MLIHRCRHRWIRSVVRQQTVPFQSVKSLHGSIYAPLHVISWPYLDIVSALTVGGQLLSLVRRCLTLCLMSYEILQSAHRPSDSRWRLIFSLPISTFSALGVSHVMRSITINARYLLTYFYFPDVIKFRVAVHTISEKAYNPDRAQGCITVLWLSACICAVSEQIKMRWDEMRKLISSSMSRHLSTRNISSKYTHAFLSNLAYRQTDRQTDKRGQMHVPPPLSEVNYKYKYLNLLFKYNSSTS